MDALFGCGIHWRQPLWQRTAPERDQVATDTSPFPAGYAPSAAWHPSALLFSEKASSGWTTGRHEKRIHMKQNRSIAGQTLERLFGETPDKPTEPGPQPGEPPL